MINIRMLEMSGDDVFSLLLQYSKITQNVKYFRMTGKKRNIWPIFTKADKQNIKNYRLVSLLPICSKLFESIIHDNIIKYF